MDLVGYAIRGKKEKNIEKPDARRIRQVDGTGVGDAKRVNGAGWTGV